MTQDEALYLIRTRGWATFPSVLPPAQIAQLVADSEAIVAHRREIQVRNGVAGNMEGTSHHVLGQGDSLDAFIDDLPLYEVIEAHFAGKIILLNFGATLNPPNARTYTQKPHRDVRSFTRGYPLSLNMLVMLDDFRADNGATLVLPGSQHVEAPPASGVFGKYAQPLLGKAGDIVLFDSLLVHSAAPNHSDASRRCLTLCFGRPFIKPQMDWTRFLSKDYLSNVSAKGRQLLGLDARMPSDLDEYYQPQPNWTFKADQI